MKTYLNLSPLRNKLAHTLAIALPSIALLTGCAPEEFQRKTETQKLGSVGFRYLPAKVDIVIVPDNTDSMNNAMLTVQANLAGFVSNLQSQYWDYHVAKSDMILPSPISQVLVNPEFNSSTLSDGTPNSSSGLVPSSKAVTSASSLSLTTTTRYGVSSDTTFQYLTSNLNTAKNDTSTNFLRDDALLAVIVVTNGYEGSIDPTGQGLINNTVLNQHAVNLRALKNGNNSLLRFYPVASYGYRSGNGGDYCLVPGGIARSGASYFAMNTLIGGLSQYVNGGETLNFCNASALQNVLTSIGQNLDSIRQSYVFSAIVLDAAPVDTSIRVYKNGQQLPRGGAHGWEYIGRQTNYATVTAIRDPNTNQETAVTLNRRTGYIIKLSGDARMVGSDTPSVEFERQ